MRTNPSLNRGALGACLLAALTLAGCGGGSSGSGAPAPAPVSEVSRTAEGEGPQDAPTPNAERSASARSAEASPARSARKATQAAGLQSAGPLSQPSVGMNLNAVSYYSPEWPFVDVFKSSRSNADGFPWDLANPKSQPTPALDADGYPRGLADGQSVSAICMRVDGNYPAGKYTVMFDGDGEVAVAWDAEDASLDHAGSGTGTFTTQVTPSKDGIVVRILRSNPQNHVRNIRVIMPGFEGTYAQQPFHPMFLAGLEPFSVLRFMDWGETNGSHLSQWSQRKRPTARTQYRGGVAYELMAQLSNTLRKDAWICVPHHASDDFVRQLATLMKAKLDPSLRLYVELSNEVWNGAFRQHKDMVKAASDKGQDWYQVYAQRSARVFRIFEEVYGGHDRLVRVVASQAGNPWVTEQILKHLPAGSADALAIAPYFGGSLGNSKNKDKTRTLSVDQVLDACAADIEKQRGLVQKHRAAAQAAGLGLIAYEGGQHLAPVGAASNDQQLVDLFVRANRHPRMGQLYVDYLRMWAAESGGVFCAFNYCYTPAKHGCWGALEHQAQGSAPKYDALKKVALEWRSSAK